MVGSLRIVRVGSKEFKNGLFEFKGSALYKIRLKDYIKGGGGVCKAAV